jgi:hypothetical protein
MTNRLSAIAVAMVLSTTALSATAFDPSKKDYAALEKATTYDIVDATSPTGPDFVVGTKYTWPELMVELARINTARGHTERAAYLLICKNDKAYYFFAG